MEEYLNKNYKVNLFSSVFICLRFNDPSIVIYSRDGEINIVSKYDYNLTRYYDKQITFIAEINGYENVEEIYDLCASSYTTTDDYKISKMIEILNSKSLSKNK